MTIHDVQTQGIIIKRTPYKDNDMILHVYTKEYGKIGIHARGIQKMSSKNARGCQMMMLSELTISLKKGLSSLIRAYPIHHYRHIQEHLESEIVAQYILEYYYRYIEENQPDEKAFEILFEALNALHQGYMPLLVYLLFQVFILEDNGINPCVDGCVICDLTQVTALSVVDGGFLCYQHQGHHSTLDKEVLKAFRHIHKIPMKNISDIHIDKEIIKKLVPIMNGFIEEYSGVTLKTSLFIQQIV
jgi:DNA repair protein RecO